MRRIRLSPGACRACRPCVLGLRRPMAQGTTLPGSIRRCLPPPRRKVRSSSIRRPTSRKACRCSRFSRRRPASRSTMCAAPTRSSTSRMTIEFRADQKSYDIVHMTTVNKLPPQLLARSTRRKPRTSPGGARSGPALVRRLRQLQFAGLQHPAGEGVRAAEELRGVRDAQGMGRQGRHRRHRQRMAAGAVRALRRAEGPRSSPRIRGDASIRWSPTGTWRWRAPPAPANTRSRSTTTSTSPSM